jgi:hypothetical protein
LGWLQLAAAASHMRSDRKESPIPGPLFCFLASDHARLDGLLRRAMTEASTVDRAAYAEFRAGLLKHISLEEKIGSNRNGINLSSNTPLINKLRASHGDRVAVSRIGSALNGAG